MRAKIPTEHDEQVTLCAWLRAHKIGFFAVPNGARVRPSQARKLKAEGMVAGIPDIILVPFDRFGRPTAIEMKRSKGGTVSPEQARVHEAMRRAGWNVIVARGAAQAVNILNGFGYL